MSERADVIVVGMGPGGEDVAGRLAEAGLDVVGVEAELVGGECPYWGCVPSKMMIRAADLLAEAGRVTGMAGTVSVHPDWTPVARRIRDEATDSWDDTGAVRRFEERGGRLVRGWGRLEGPTRVVVGDRSLEADRAVVLNIGTRAWIPPVAGLADTPYWTNREAIETEEVPTSLAVMGGGSVGVELAQVFRRFGAEVAVLEAGPWLVGPEEPEAGALLAEVFEAEGIDVRTGVDIEAVHHDGHRFAVSLGAGEAVVADRLLVATGRRPDLVQLNVGSIGLDASARALPVDDHLRVEGTTGVWAVGDVGRPRRLHPPLDVPRRHRGQRHPGPPGGAGRLPGRAPGHLHRPRDRLGGPERAGRPSPGHRGAGGDGRHPRVGPGVDPQGPATRASSSWWRTPSAGYWSGPPRRDRPGARCSASSPWPCTPRWPPPSSGT